MKKFRSSITYFFRWKSIRTSMLVGFLPLSIIALLFVYGFSFKYTEDNVLDNSVKYTLQLIDQVNSDIDSYITYMENTSLLVSGSGDVRDYLFLDQSEEQKDILRSRILDQFQTVREARTDIYNIGVVSVDGKYIINDGADNLNPYVDIKNQSWYQQALAKDGGSVLSSSHVQNIIMNEYPWVVTSSSRLTYPGRETCEGVFFIDLNYNAINELCDKINLGNHGYVFILDEEGNILYHPKQQLIYSGLKRERVNEVLSCPERYFQTDEGKESKLYTISFSEKTKWTVVGVAYTSELVKNRTQTQLIYFLLISVMLLAIIGISVFLSKRITSPILKLKNSMKEMEKGHFQKIDLDTVPENEVRSLSKSFNVMTDEIQNLMKENIEEQRLKRKSEMRALQSQINPHFLYNTLDSIVWMAEWGKTKEVVHMTTALAKMFRRTISNDQEVVTVEQEVDYVRNYLEIQQMRYKDKLSYELAIDEEIMNRNIIKLVLQPLVENAIYHGIKYKEAQGVIRIEGKRKQDLMVLKVMDNGPGMEEEQLAHIFDKHKVNYQRNGVGVYNVQTRLQLFYGKEYGVTYESKLGEGTAASIIVPFEQGGGAI